MLGVSCKYKSDVRVNVIFFLGVVCFGVTLSSEGFVVK